MKFFQSKNTPKKAPKKVRREDAIEHLSEKFGIPTADMTATFENKKGWRAGKEEWKDTLHIKVKQPIERPTLHHDMTEELKQVFRAQYGAGAFNPKAMKFYFGVSEDKEHTAKLNAERPRDQEIEMAPEIV